MAENKNLTLTLETGAITIDLIDERGKKIGEFDFNPSDSNIFKRYGKVVDFFNATTFDTETPEEEQMEAINKLADDIAEQLNYLLGYQAANGIFQNCGPLTITPSGDFFFESVLEGVGSIIEKTSKKRVDKKLARIRKATSKYTDAAK